MEHVAGRPLSEVMPRDGLPAERVIGLGHQIAEAIAHAHAHGILHRDFKPLNVVVTPDGRPKVLDFGLATRERHDEAAHAPTTPLARSEKGTERATSSQERELVRRKSRNLGISILLRSLTVRLNTERPRPEPRP